MRRLLFLVPLLLSLCSKNGPAPSVTPPPSPSPSPSQPPSPSPTPSPTQADPPAPEQVRSPSLPEPPAAPAPSIVERPITWNAERRRLSLEYLSLRHGLTREEPVITPVMVVLHATESATLSSAFHTFNPVRLPPGERPFLAKASQLNVSAHFLVDRDGTLVRLLPETTFARHAVGLNWCAIGVENVGGTPKTPLNDAQARANAALIRHLAGRFPIRHVIGHHEYLAYRKTPLWKETSTTYFTHKSDPGAEFMRQVRTLLADLSLEPVPSP